MTTVKTADVTGPGWRVPVEHRVLGMDRRTVGLAAFALAVWVLWTWVLPRINSSVAYDDPVRAGDVVQVTARVTMVPAVGWDLQSGLRTTDRTLGGDTSSSAGVVLVGDSVSLYARPGPFGGTPSQLLDQITLITSTTSAKEGFHVVGDRRTVVTTSGLTGVAEGFESPRVTGVVAAFVADEGIQVQVVGTPAQMTSEAPEVEAMIDSLTYTPAGPR